jgi:hypothetical protein
MKQVLTQTLKVLRLLSNPNSVIFGVGVLCRPFGTRLIDLIPPGTDVLGYRLFRPCGTGFLAVSKSLRTSQQAETARISRETNFFRSLFSPGGGTSVLQRLPFPDKELRSLAQTRCEWISQV